MGNWYCKCGVRMSDGLVPTPNGYEVFTSKQCCDGNLDEQRAYADAYICPDCGRIMIFGRDTKEYILYSPEPIDDTPQNNNEKGSFKVAKSFSEEAWDAYSSLCEKEDVDSINTVNEINGLLHKLQDDGVRDMSVRNKIVGSEYQICYRVHRSTIEVISIEWIFE